MKLAALQLDITWEDRTANYARVRRFAGKAKEAGAGLLILPEMFATGFSFKTEVTAEPQNSETAEFLRSLAREFEMAVVGGFVLKKAGDLPHNVALAVDSKGSDLALYSKVHLFNFTGEDKIHGSGTGPATFDLNGLKAACFICYDLRFPELFRLVADNCDLVIVIASWPSERQEHWDVLLRARAIENLCYVAGVNRVGQGGKISYSGGSVILDPWGVVLADGGCKEALIVTEVDPARVKEIRSSYPFLRDRRF